MGERINEVGNRYGRLTVVEYAWTRKNNGKYAMWRCKCDCGKEVVCSGHNLREGNTKSCGCLNIENSTKRIVSLNTKHGQAHTRLFRVWSSMLTRCENKNATNYSIYGGRGINVCAEWHDFARFSEWAYANGYDENAKRGECTIDRIDNNVGYSPENCRFVNYKVQANNRRNTRLITYNGVTKSAAGWSDFYGRDVSLFENLSDDEAVARIEAYERYKAVNHVDKLPRRVNVAKYVGRRL